MRSRYVSSTSSTAPARSASFDERFERRPVEHRPGRVVRARDRDQTRRAGADSRRDPSDVELPAALEREVDDVEFGADRARRLEIRRVVGAHDDGVVARLEERGRRREERGGRARRDEHVVGVDAVPAGRNRVAEQRITEVIAVAEQRSSSEARSSPRSPRRRSATELSDRLFVIVS